MAKTFFSKNFQIFYHEILRFFTKKLRFFSENYEIFFQKILSPETYWIYGKNFESGNLLNIWQKLVVWKLIEYMVKILRVFTKKFWNFFQKVLRYFLKTFWVQKHWIYGKHFESWNLFNTWQKLWDIFLKIFRFFTMKFWDFAIWQKFWVCKLIEYMAKILSLETYWIYGKKFEIFYQKSLRFFSEDFEIFSKKFWVWKLIESMAKILRFFTNKFWNFVQKVLRFFQKIFNPETYWIFCKNSKSGNLLNIWQTFWDFFKKIFKFFAKKFWDFLPKNWDFFQKIMRFFSKNFESGNLLNIWQKFWVWKLIEHMAKIRGLETYWTYGKN